MTTTIEFEINPGSIASLTEAVKAEVAPMIEAIRDAASPKMLTLREMHDRYFPGIAADTLRVWRKQAREDPPQGPLAGIPAPRWDRGGTVLYSSAEMDAWVAGDTRAAK